MHLAEKAEALQEEVEELLRIPTDIPWGFLIILLYEFHRQQIMIFYLNIYL